MNLPVPVSITAISSAILRVSETFNIYDDGKKRSDRNVFFKPTGDGHLKNTEKSFFKNPCRHFWFAANAFGKDNGYFWKFKTIFPCEKFHFDLESIAYKFYPIERNSFQYFSSIANKTGRRIANGHAGYQSHIGTSKIRK